MEYPMEYLDGLPLKVMYWSDRILYKDGGESVTWYEPAPGKTTSNSSEVLPPGIVQVNEGEPATLKWNYGLTFNIELTVVRFNKAGIFTADVSPQLKERFRGRFMPGSVSLDIFNVTMADDKEKGKFSLELIDPDGNGWKREIEVEVIVPTKVTGIRGDLSVLEGANLLLTCEASGRPKPNITWTNKRNSGVVQEGKLLNVTNINRNDSGTFTCTADNGFGEPQSQTVYVNVICAEEDTAIISSVDPVKHPQATSKVASETGDPLPQIVVVDQTKKTPKPGELLSVGVGGPDSTIRRETLPRVSGGDAVNVEICKTSFVNM
ncbi:opioid-binding protein/cell adhesion molecule-like [Stylophora pistillata]|uniref:opioid-binding protein/cell adhesion molecule-like n=1 Tax=Stylophora pistillata TaxID=50429 RepID=UPI000C04A26C|nr:opioid-binding protein/cell adhesion molecule-like [Stylophora pistillata]